jgi:hypothetical protein
LRTRFQAFLNSRLYGALLLGSILALLGTGAVYFAFHPAKRDRHPVGFGPDWECASNGMKGGGFCLRKGSPPVAKPAS